ncbi:MAG: histidine kinase [Spirosoma sp.]|nr:histidine kinase [Spirosoma sp.]
MDQFTDFFRRLTDTSDWPPRWFCGNWTDFHGWLYIFSDLTVWLAYMAIPLILVRFVTLKKGVPMPSVFLLFGAFIMLCGATHLLDATMFWWPAYRLNALIRFLTGVVSIATVIALIRYFNEAIGLRTSGEYESELQFRQQAVQELSRSNQELQQFAYVASHDLQAPLKTIVNYLTLLEAKYGEQLDVDGRKLINTSTAAAGRMRTLINDLLDFSRVGSVAEFESVDMNALIAEILEEHQEEVKAANATVDLEPLPTLTAHRTDLKQVFQNLITNGLKYRLPNAATRLKIYATDEGKSYRFAVADNGIGIAPQHYERVFQIFQRLHSRTDYPGTGIGLATCKKIIDIYGGQIWLDSTPGVGTTFYLTIPKNIKTVQQYVQTDPLHSLNR